MKLIVFIFCFLTTASFAQTKITGRIIDERNVAVANATVYINNNTYGTTTDSLGNFTLNCKLVGRAELVVSHIQYQKKLINLQLGNTEKLVVKLVTQTNTLNEVVIRSKKHSKTDLSRWIKLASEILIGTYNRESSLCKIKNPEVLYFDFDKATNILKVYAKGSLLIENAYLAYLIKLDMDQFEYNFNNNEVTFKYSTFYQNLAQEVYSAEEIKSHRQIAYEGSTLHFMRAIYTRKPVQEGFQIYRYKEVTNKEKDRVRALINSKIAKAYGNEEHPDLTLNRFFPKDSVKHYVEVMKQHNVLKFDTTSIGIAKLVRDDQKQSAVNFDFTDTVLVNYRKLVLTDQTTGPKIGDSLFERQKNKSAVQVKPELTSFLYFYNQGGINIEKNGYYSEMSLFMYGDMPSRRLAGALPFDFEPDYP